MKDLDMTPIACSLTTAELRDRAAALLAQFSAGIIETEELQEGYAFRLPGDGKWIALIAELIVAERQCCAFLKFLIAALRNRGSVIVRVNGPAGTKEFLRTVLSTLWAWLMSTPSPGADELEQNSSAEDWE
jgi:hypothetical protein